MTVKPQKMLIVLTDLTDSYRESSLYEAIVQLLERQGLGGATVFSGIMGFGRHRQIHRKGLFGMADEKPVCIISIDDEAKIMAVVPMILPMVEEGLISVQDIQVYLPE
jgi:uncharacterized protein